MQENDALPGGGEVTDGLLELRGAKLAVVTAEEEEVGLREQLKGLLEIRGRGDVITGGFDHLCIRAEEELREVVRATSTGHEDAELACLASAELLPRRGRGARVIRREVVILHSRTLGLRLTLSGNNRRDIRLRRIRRATDFSGDRHGRRSHGVTGAGQDDLLDDLGAFHRQDERAHVVILHQALGELRTPDFGIIRIIIREITAGHLGDDLLAAADKTNLNRHGRQATNARPTTDGAQEVQAGSGHTNRNFDGLREGLRISAARTALEDDDVLAVLRLGGVDNVVGHAIGGDLTKLHERQGVPLGLAAGVEAPAGVRRHGRREVQ